MKSTVIEIAAMYQERIDREVAIIDTYSSEIIKPKTLSDVYHNIEIIKKRLKLKIDKMFDEDKQYREIMSILKDTGVLFINRKQNEKKYFVKFDPIN